MWAGRGVYLIIFAFYIFCFGEEQCEGLSVRSSEVERESLQVRVTAFDDLQRIGNSNWDGAHVVCYNRYFLIIAVCRTNKMK